MEPYEKPSRYSAVLLVGSLLLIFWSTIRGGYDAPLFGVGPLTALDGLILGWLASISSAVVLGVVLLLRWRQKRKSN
jgi:hypothetical protein